MAEAANHYTEEQLRYALAINRGIAMLNPATERGKKVQAEFGKLFTPVANATTKPDEVLYHLHQGLFEDWRQPTETTVADSVKRGRISEFLKDLLWNPQDGLIDANNFPIIPENLPMRLAGFHKAMAELEPFAYGNKFTTEFFLTALFDQPVMKEVYPAGIDFRRLDDEDRKILRNPESTAEQLAAAFAHAMEFARTPSLQNERNGFGTWNQSSIEISGVKFLAHQEGDQTYVVTVNGGLVPKEIVEEQMIEHRAKNALMADFPLIATDKFLPETEETKKLGIDLQALRQKRIIDGITIDDPKAAPLCCMDINILTGLRPTSHSRLEALFKSVCKEGDKFPFDIGEKPYLKEKMLAEAGSDVRLRRSVQIAFERVCHIHGQMKEALENEFAGVKPSDNPQFVMSMGGGGSGKSAAKDITKAVSDGNYVEASLDAFRNHSDLYKLLLAANHHTDDYTLVQGMAGTLRDWVKEKALKENYNLLYDGTGVDYAGRYDKITKEFKDKGYTTRLCAVDSSIDKAIDNVKGRYDREGRALVWPVVTGKHANFPDSFMAAAADKNFDKVMLFANDKGYGEHHLVAETHKIAPAEIAILNEAKKNGTLTEEFTRFQQREDSALQLLKGKDSGYQHRPPVMTEANSAFIRVGDVKHSSVLTLYEADRFTKMLEKGQMNKAASSPGSLWNSPLTMRFAVEPKNSHTAGLNI